MVTVRFNSVYFVDLFSSNMGYFKLVPQKVDLLTNRAQRTNKLNEASDLKAMDTMHNEFREQFWKYPICLL